MIGTARCAVRTWQRDVPGKKKAAGFRTNPAAQFCEIQFRLVFDYHTLNRAMLGRSGVINPNLLTRSQRSCHSVASRVNNVRSCAKRETYRALFAPDDNSLT